MARDRKQLDRFTRRQQFSLSPSLPLSLSLSLSLSPSLPHSLTHSLSLSLPPSLSLSLSFTLSLVKLQVQIENDVQHTIQSKCTLQKYTTNQTHTNTLKSATAKKTPAGLHNVNLPGTTAIMGKNLCNNIYSPQTITKSHGHRSIDHTRHTEKGMAYLHYTTTKTG